MLSYIPENQENSKHHHLWVTTLRVYSVPLLSPWSNILKQLNLD